MKCEAEINAGIAALKGTPKCTTEETERKESTKQTSHQGNHESSVPELKTDSKKKMEDKLVGSKLEKPGKETKEA